MRGLRWINLGLSLVIRFKHSDLNCWVPKKEKKGHSWDYEWFRIASRNLARPWFKEPLAREAWSELSLQSHLFLNLSAHIFFFFPLPTHIPRGKGAMPWGGEARNQSLARWWGWYDSRDLMLAVKVRGAWVREVSSRHMHMTPILLIIYLIFSEHLCSSYVLLAHLARARGEELELDIGSTK